MARTAPQPRKGRGQVLTPLRLDYFLTEQLLYPDKDNPLVLYLYIEGARFRPPQGLFPQV